MKWVISVVFAVEIAFVASNEKFTKVIGFIQRFRHPLWNWTKLEKNKIIRRWTNSNDNYRDDNNGDGELESSGKFLRAYILIDSVLSWESLWNQCSKFVCHLNSICKWVSEWVYMNMQFYDVLYSWFTQYCVTSCIGRMNFGRENKQDTGKKRRKSSKRKETSFLVLCHAFRC